MRSNSTVLFFLCYGMLVGSLITPRAPKAPPMPTMVTPVSLAVSTAAPEDPPVYGPCAPMNPLTQYIPFDHNGLLWSWQCYLAYKAELQGQIVAYWVAISRCPAGDCACYKEAWDQFERNMREAEIQLVECGQNPEG